MDFLITELNKYQKCKLKENLLEMQVLITSLACIRRELTNAFLCLHIPFFAVAVLQDMGSYVLGIFKT